MHGSGIDVKRLKILSIQSIPTISSKEGSGQRKHACNNQHDPRAVYSVGIYYIVASVELTQTECVVIQWNSTEHLGVSMDSVPVIDNTLAVP